MGGNVAGASARAKAVALRAEELERRRQLKARSPVLGRLALAMAGPPTAGESWAKGAVGEERLGAALESIGDSVLVLHDRRRPRTTANIDHLAVASSGVWVIDTKRYAGRITSAARGTRLVIAGRNRTKLVEGVHKQLADVARVLGDGVAVHGALCFVDGEFGLFAKPFTIDGVLVTWGKDLRQRLTKPGPIGAEDRASLHQLLDRRLRPA